MSAEQIRTALTKLDPAQDPHWTKEGEPAVSLVNIFGNGKYSRDEIESAWPGFNRSNAAELSAAGYTPPAPAPAVPPAPPAPPALAAQSAAETPAPIVPAHAVAAPTQAKNEAPSSEAEFKMKALQSELESIEGYIDEANARKAAVIKELDALTVASAANAVGFGDTNAAYLQAQQRALANRGEQLKAVREAGITRKMLDEVIPKGAKIDQALRSRQRQV